MPKKKKTQRQWTSSLRDFAASGKETLGSGAAPNKHTSKQIRDAYEAIQKCPVQRGHTGNDGIASFFGASGTGGGACKCKWHDGTHGLLKQYFSQQAAATTPAPTALPPIVVPFLIPEKPDHFKSIENVIDKTKTYVAKPSKSKVVFDLTVFGHTDGSCPNCGGVPRPRNDLLKSVRTIHTLSQPRFVQGVGMGCTTCNRTWQSFKKGYVETLPKYKQKELDAIIVGNANGIDMELVVMLRSGSSALSIQRACFANLIRWHEQLRDGYLHRCQLQRALGMIVDPRPFPLAPDPSWAAKQEMLMRAFIRDYLSVRNGLNREMAALRSEHSIAIDHQAKVVKHAKGGNASQTFAAVSDTGLVLAYVAVPNEDMAWVDLLMKEIVERHGGILDPNNKHRLSEVGEMPPLVYVDKDCCNGREGGRTDGNKYFYGMLKLCWTPSTSSVVLGGR